MMVLKINQIPKGLISLERLINHDEIPLKTTLEPHPEEVKDCNIGTEESPRLVKVSR
jgi:hypothetical protein